jgi:peptidoglycan/LPS O-acetylase OafA/YrhL
VDSGYRFAVRNRYLDLLRAAAIVRVVVYHLFGWPWLSILLPAMGIMFALAGSLTAASLDKRGAGRVVTSRLRRLLPPLWLLGLIAVPAMLAAGWAAESDGEHPFSPARLVFWLLPLGDPPGSDRAVDVWEPLWYVRAYVWFVLLSPVFYLAYRRLGWIVVAAPILLIAALDKTGFSLPETADAAMWDFATYGACWLAGFAHHDGRLRRLHPAAVTAAAAVLGAAALYWLSGHPGENGWDLNDVSESQALWSLAVVLLALRWQPPMDWLARVRPLDATVTLLNNRAVTVYLWHNIAIALVFPVLTWLALDELGALDGPADLIGALVLTAGAVLAFGWAEDLAARRRPRLWPARGGSRADAGRAGEQTSDEPGRGPGGGRSDEPARGGRTPDGAGPRQWRRSSPGGSALPESVLRLATAPAPPQAAHHQAAAHQAAHHQAAAHQAAAHQAAAHQAAAHQAAAHQAAAHQAAAHQAGPQLDPARPAPSWRDTDDRPHPPLQGGAVWPDPPRPGERPEWPWQRADHEGRPPHG